jgi:hypothetical protein
VGSRQPPETGIAPAPPTRRRPVRGLNSFDPDTAAVRRSHLLQLQLNGVSVEGHKGHVLPCGDGHFGEVHLDFADSILDGTAAIPRKVPIVPEASSPYRLSDGRILRGGEEVFGQGAFALVLLPERGKPSVVRH